MVTPDWTTLRAVDVVWVANELAMLTKVPAAVAEAVTFKSPEVLAVVVKLVLEVIFARPPVVKASTAVLLTLSRAPAVRTEVAWLRLTP